MLNRVTTAALVVLAATLLGTPLTAQVTPSAWVEIVEPTEWRGEGTRGIGVASGDAVRVVGRARHPNGIERVLINGLRATLSQGSAGVTRFVGYVNVDPSVLDVEIAVYPRGDRAMVRTFDVRPLPAPADQQVSWDSPEDAGFRGERWAVVIGISEYADPSIPALRYADDDARAMYDFLTSEAAGLGGFDPENILFLQNDDATFLNMRQALFDFLKGPTEEDIVLVYFAGHGAPDPERPGEYYLLPYDTRVDAIAGTSFPMDDVTSAIGRTYARDMIVITDACHSAGVGGLAGLRDVGLNQINQTFLEQLEATSGGIAIFTASESNQFSQEGEQWGGGHGVFTWKILEALRGAADDNGDRIVNLGEMMEYVRAQVARETRNSQIPTISQTAFDRSWPMSVVLEEPASAVEPEPEPTPEPTPTPGDPAAEPALEPEGEPDPEAGPEPESDEEPARVARIRLDRTELELTAGERTGLMARALTADGGMVTDRPVTWRSSDSDGLAVDRFGELRASAVGRYTVTAAADGEEATATVYVYPKTYSVGGLVAHSLVLPGSGQLRTGKPLLGLAALATAAGAVAAGVMSEQVEVDCASPAAGGDCPETDILEERVTRPYLLYGVGAAAAVALWSGIDAAMSASAANRRADALRRQWGRSASSAPAPVLIDGRLGIGFSVPLPASRGR